MTHGTTVLAALSLAVSTAALALAQQPSAPPAELPADSLALADLSAFQPLARGASWRVASAVVADRTRALALTSSTGAGVLVNAAPPGQGASLVTTWEHGDLELEMEVMMPKGSDAGVFLQGRYELQFADSWTNRRPTFADMGGISQRWDAARGQGREGYEGMAPRVNASRAPGLWQSLAIRFQAPRFDGDGRKVADARFVRVELNGVVIHQNVRVTGPTRGAAFQDERPTGPLVLQGDRGPVAVRHVRFKRFGVETVRVAGLRYRAWKTESPAIATATAGAPAREGQADAITASLAGAPDNFALAFDGTVRVPTAGTYLFDLGFDWVDDDPQFKGTVVGGGELSIDGTRVLAHEGRLANATGTATLSAGEHRIALAVAKVRPWTNRSAFTLFVEGPGVERQALHQAAPPNVPGAIVAEPEGEPLVLRGFVTVGDGKRTHAAAIADPAGVHYALDFAQGALLAAWRGPFAETTEMWHDRGNDQSLMPEGSVLALSGAPGLAVLPDDKAAWPDTLAAGDLRFLGYRLAEGGRPVFRYRVRDVDVEDRLRPADDGLSLRRELVLRAPDATARLHVRIASGSAIRRGADGSWLVDDARFYVTFDPGAPAPMVRAAPSGTGQELLVPIRFTGGVAAVAYTLIW